MSKKDPFIYPEYPLFNGIVDRGVFESFNTSEKIKLLLQKDIFKIGNTWYNHEFYCGEDFSKLDFSVFEKLDFNLNETYKIDNKIISLNPLVATEVFKGICGAIYLCPKTTAFLNEIKFQSTTLSKQKDKEKFLRKEIARIDPFKLPTLLVEFDWNKNEIGLAPEQSIEIVSNNPDFIQEWITGEHNPGGMYLTTKHPNLNRFYSSYQQFITAEFCYNELQNLKNTESEIEESAVENKDKFTAYQQTYFLVKTGLVKKLRSANYSEIDIARLVSKLINRSFDNVRKDIRTITSERIEHQSKEDSKKKIDDIIKEFTNLG
jgi:hypothetical protein